LNEDTEKFSPPAIILFGSPGSGKGTQAKLLNERFGWPHVSTGDMLRTHIAAGDQIGQEIQQLMKAGRLVPDELVNRLVQRRLAQPDCRNGVILDGYPRTLRQAGVSLGIMENYDFRPAVVYLVVDNARIIARLSGRRQCPVCGTLYSLKTHPPKVPGICDLDGATLITREDDKESVIRERLNEYDHETRPLLEYFREAGLVMIETQGASRTPEQIVQATVDALSAAGVIPAEPVPNANAAK
jgi:adenylate kinase